MTGWKNIFKQQFQREISYMFAILLQHSKKNLHTSQNYIQANYIQESDSPPDSFILTFSSKAEREYEFRGKPFC